MEGVLILAALGGGTVAVFIALRFWIVLHHRVVPRESLSLLVVAGSGGHTTEILRLLGNLSNAYSPRHYIFADTDEMSAHKIRAFEVDRAERYSSTMVLCNGPGTCVPICLSALLLGILGIKKVIIVYVESVCRVETLSLSGKILYYLSDYFIVQWPTLKEKYPKSVYLGRIV
ncbi:UDP-N-acetylglucosamine transferase subunit ALG14 homolog isoform X3 [Loxodonta africana]|uniref:UDP-N-acetylglucosamine transferase subunit ALG14 homolog isoform X4 n=1 Tax=Elephas maximus indicus TaxID=99487 RepID=UPI002116A9A1|nr:UDP-N-acetylglucosamine transferase subunit ALG14 homolog isoform X4 [Elephas maximus indicus]